MMRNFQSSTPPIPPYPSVPQSAPNAASYYTSPYLPEGAPPWPTSVPQRPPQPMLTSITTNGTTTERKARSARGLLLGLGLSILAVLVGVGLTLGVLFTNGQLSANQPQAQRALPVTQPTSASGATSTGTPSTSSANALPTPNSFSTMSSANQKVVGVLVKYPSNWVEVPPQAQQSSDGSGVVIFHPQQQLGIVVYVGKFPVATSGANSTSAMNTSIINAIYGGTSSGNVSLKAVQPSNPHPTVAGTQWDEQDATFSDSNGIPRYIASISVKRGTTFYTFSFQSPQMYLSDAGQKYIQPMLDSFKFLS